MEDARTISAAWIRIGAGLLALAAASACAMNKAAPRQTDIMQKTGAVSVSSAELRAQMNDLAERLAGRLEQAADLIRAETRDRVVRRRTLVFKVDAIPAVYTAAYRADPLTAAMDVWGLAFQINQYVDEGAGREAFGQQQGMAREAARGTGFLRARRSPRSWPSSGPGIETPSSPWQRSRTRSRTSRNG
jgi:hypothetical protein